MLVSRKTAAPILPFRAGSAQHCVPCRSHRAGGYPACNSECAPRPAIRRTVRNAVLILHGTGGSGRQFFGSPTSSANFAEQLFGPGQLLDATKYFIVMPDNV